MIRVKSLLSKILVAQVVTVILALLVVMSITRASLNRGFMEFLERQESTVLNNLAPSLANLYESQGSWDFLRESDRNWERIMRQARPQRGDRQGGGPRPRNAPRAGNNPSPNPPEGHLIPSFRTMDRLHFKERLFLLDDQKRYVAGAKSADALPGSLEKIQFNEEIVGWIGFTPMGEVLPPEARRFLGSQIRILTISLVIALVLAGTLAFLLARHLSQPVTRLDSTVVKLTEGNYLARAAVSTGDEIGRLARNVNQLAETLERNRSARQRWMADIAHELRTPVAILKGEIEALTDGVRQVDERMVVSLREEVDQLTALIEDLQTLALADAGALNIHKESADLAELVNQSVESFNHRLASRNISLEAPSGNTMILSCDQQRIRQLLHNLLENSSRYVEPGGRVRISLSREAQSIEMVVEDSGPGVSNDKLSRLFDRFYRVEGSRSKATGGTGLGLSICKNIVEAHGGTILAAPSQLGGLKIIVMLPT
jgi:two-component system sensor histidine kinase BaeS